MKTVQKLIIISVTLCNASIIPSEEAEKIGTEQKRTGEVENTITEEDISKTLLPQGEEVETTKGTFFEIPSIQIPTSSAPEKVGIGPVPSSPRPEKPGTFSTQVSTSSRPELEILEVKTKSSYIQGPLSPIEIGPEASEIQVPTSSKP